MFVAIPLGLAANLIVAALILRRAGRFWGREPVAALAPAGVYSQTEIFLRSFAAGHICVLSFALNSCSLLQAISAPVFPKRCAVKERIAQNSEVAFGRSHRPDRAGSEAPWCIGGPIKS
jgi:hypothetical protein